MYIYQTGLISELIHEKIANAKSGNTSSAGSFGDMLRSMMVNTSGSTKTVGISNVSGSDSPIARADGRTLLYALTNSDTDAAASAVVGALGLPISDNNIKAAADSVTSAVTLLGSAAGADKEQAIKLITDFTDKFNALLTDLSAQSTTSGIMYTRLFSTAAKSASEALASAGITVGDDGKLTFDAQKFEDLSIEEFLSSIATAANAVSTYASSITGSQSSSLLDFLGESDDSAYSTTNYYTSLINSMM